MLMGDKKGCGSKTKETKKKGCGCGKK